MDGLTSTSTLGYETKKNESLLSAFLIQALIIAGIFGFALFWFSFLRRFCHDAVSYLYFKLERAAWSESDPCRCSKKLKKIHPCPKDRMTKEVGRR